MPGGWPFEDPPNVAVLTTRDIVERRAWIGLVSHDADDGDWQFLPYEGVPDGEAEALAIAMVIALSNALKLDPSIAELADLPLGWQATRRRLGDPWQRRPHPEGANA